MADLYRATTQYRLPIFCAAGVSHHVPAEVKWELTILDDGFRKLDMAEINITEFDYGEA